MIKSITLKDIASYTSNGVELTDLKKLNFFFGFNGSGKSTIAKYIYNLSVSEGEKSTEFNSCSQTGYNSENEQILVFDENFIELNFIKKDSLKGVFSLNQTNELIDSKITNEENLIKGIKNYIKKRQELKDTIESDRESKRQELLYFCWSQRNSFSTFTKISLDFSGRKVNHFNKIKEELDSKQDEILTIEQLSDEYNRLYEKEIVEITDTIDVKIYQKIRETETKLEILLNEVIIGNEDVDISTLIKTLNARSWIERGVEFIKHTDKICPFCQKETITENLKRQFSELFDETYKKKIEQITKLLDEYKDLTSAFLENIKAIQETFNENNIASSIYTKLQDLFSSNISIINDKINNSNEKKSIISLITLKKELSNITNVIKNKNEIFAKLDNKKDILKKNIWQFMAYHCEDRINEFNKTKIKYERIVTLADELIKNRNNKINHSRGIIEDLRSQTVNTKEAVDNINLILKNSGFESFEIEEKEKINNISQYYLKRPNTTDGNPIFKSLSEGEKNFIAFLYFYQLCVGTDDIQTNSSKKKIIVIDDPVSSLDSLALFVISTLIHQLVLRKADNPKTNRKEFKNENISQVFVLTHNLYFYKEVSFDKRPICTDYWHFKVNKINNKTVIEGQRDKKVFDDYSMLWQTIKDIKSNLPSDKSLNVVIANTMRRIIESYVNFIGLGKDSWSAVLNTDVNNPEYYLKRAFISTINDESHKVAVLDTVYYQKLSGEQPEVLFNVFKEIFKEIGKEHYKMLMEEEF